MQDAFPHSVTTALCGIGVCTNEGHLTSAFTTSLLPRLGAAPARPGGG